MWYIERHRKRIIFFWLLCLTLVAISCSESGSSDREKTQERIITVSKKPDTVNLYFKAKINPVKIEKVLSPQEGRITKLNFKYGQFVKQNQAIISIGSQKLEERFQQSLSRYLQSKDRMLNSATSFEGAKILYKDDIISRQEFLNEQSRYQNSKLSLLEERLKLTKIIDEIPQIDEKKIEALNLEDIDQIQAIYNRQLNELPVLSPATGIVLYPEKSDKDQDKKLIIGQRVNKDQVLVSVGDMTGIRVDFTVGQKDINTIKKGLPVTIGNDALGNDTLDGVVTDVGVQSISSQTSDKADFPIRVLVKGIEERERDKLRVGMAAKVQISIKSTDKIMVPINAVNSEAGKHFVTVINPKNQQRSKREIITGRTLSNDVIVKNGLQAGEQIVVVDRS